MLNVGVIVQARMTSKRFPGKSMALLDGMPVIQHVLDRCIDIRPKTIIVIAVPDTDASEPLLEFVDKNYSRDIVDNSCGSEDNVLERFYKTALFFEFDVIVRITGDCPYLNPKVSSEVVELLLDKKYDYTSNVFPDRTFPRGYDTECFTMDCLEAAYLASNEPTMIDAEKKYKLYCKEHVTPWMQHHKEVKRGLVKQKINREEQNLCVDVPEDIARLEELTKKPKFKLIGKK